MDKLRPKPFFIADAPALDFLNSIATPGDTPVEWLASGVDLLDWLQASELAPAEVLMRLRRTAVPGELDVVAAQARAMREWFRGFVHEHMGKRLRPRDLKDLAPLNRVLERDQEYGQIGKRERPDDRNAPSGLSWRRLRRWRDPHALLLPIARCMADLITQDDFSRVRVCPGLACTLLFIDRTQGRARRWCSMALCGNRAKQAAHRRRGRRAGRGG